MRWSTEEKTLRTKRRHLRNGLNPAGCVCWDPSSIESLSWSFLCVAVCLLAKGIEGKTWRKKNEGKVETLDLEMDWCWVSFILLSCILVGTLQSGATQTEHEFRQNTTSTSYFCSSLLGCSLHWILNIDCCSTLNSIINIDIELVIVIICGYIMLTKQNKGKPGIYST